MRVRKLLIWIAVPLRSNRSWRLPRLQPRSPFPSLALHRCPREHSILECALSNVSGVCLITDTHAGKQYVGSAYGGEGIWQRWCAYAKSGHGGNKELRELLHAKGRDYCHHFQYAMLEVLDLNVSDEYALKRESHWKNALLTREFGYNRN